MLDNLLGAILRFILDVFYVLKQVFSCFRCLEQGRFAVKPQKCFVDQKLHLT